MGIIVRVSSPMHHIQIPYRVAGRLLAESGINFSCLYAAVARLA